MGAAVSPARSCRVDERLTEVAAGQFAESTRGSFRSAVTSPGRQVSTQGCMVQVPGGGQYVRPRSGSTAFVRRATASVVASVLSFLDGPTPQVAWAFSGVSFALSRPPRTWRRWFVFVLLLNPGSPCLLPELPNRVGHSAVIDGLRQFLPKFRRPCRRLPESVRVSAGI